VYKIVALGLKSLTSNSAAEYCSEVTVSDFTAIQVSAAVCCNDSRGVCITTS